MQITDALVAEGTLALEDRAFVLSDSGRTAFADLGIDLDALGGKGRRLGRACLDWSERRYHLAGPLGVALASTVVRAELDRTDAHTSSPPSHQRRPSRDQGPVRGDVVLAHHTRNELSRALPDLSPDLGVHLVGHHLPVRPGAAGDLGVSTDSPSRAWSCSRGAGLEG